MSNRISVTDVGARLAAATVHRLERFEAAFTSFLARPPRASRPPAVVRVLLPDNGDGSDVPTHCGGAELHVYDASACTFTGCKQRHGGRG
jgi:hypothetical protein